MPKSRIVAGLDQNMHLLQRIKIRWWLFVAARKRKRGQYEAALREFKRVSALQPSRAFAFAQTGFCLEKLSRHREAVDAYERALQIAPNYADAHAFLSLAYRELGRDQEALHSLNRAVRIKPRLLDDEFWLCQLGLMRGGAQQWDEALEAFQDLTRLNAKNGHAWSGVGWANANLNRIPEAVAAYERAVQLIPSDSIVQSELGLAYLSLGRPREGLEHLQESLRLCSGPDTLRSICDAYCQLGNFQEALVSELEALRLDPHSACGQLRLASIYSTLGRHEEALQVARAALSLDPANSDIHCQVARDSLELHRLPEALAAAKEAVRLNPKSAYAHLCLGCALHEEKNYPEAVAAYEKCLELDSEQFEARANLGEIHLNLGQYEDALTDLLAASQVQPKHPQLRFYLGEVYARLGRRAEAEEELRGLRELGDPLAEKLAKLMNSNSATP
jgi:tetratricopeptide (TPR) repeat protein